jgi:predicted Zn-dependent protease
MPGNRLVVFSGLIGACENAEELCGVLAHEIAHMEEGHIIVRLA